jgi:hypothetical protein
MFILFDFAGLFKLAVKDLPSCDGFPQPCFLHQDGTCVCGSNN